MTRWMPRELYSSDCMMIVKKKKILLKKDGRPAYLDNLPANDAMKKITLYTSVLIL